jgi:hypothetical protein
MIAALGSVRGIFGAGQLCFGGKAPGGWRTPKRFARFGYARFTRQRPGVRRPAAALARRHGNFPPHKAATISTFIPHSTMLPVDTVLRNERPIEALPTKNVEEPIIIINCPIYFFRFGFLPADLLADFEDGGGLAPSIRRKVRGHFMPRDILAKTGILPGFQIKPYQTDCLPKPSQAN